MDHEQPPPVGGLVDGVARDEEVAVFTEESAHHLVVVAGDVNETRALAAFAQDFLDDIVMALRPVTAAAQAPDVDEVADEVQRLALGGTQEIEHGVGVAAAGAKVEIGNPGGAIMGRGHVVLCSSPYAVPTPAT